MLRIAITGGPCAGKSTIKSHLIQLLESRLDFKIFWVPETASELILNGISPSEEISGLEFQNFVLDKQIAKEEMYEKAASFYDPDKTIIFYDRGILDCAAYVEKEKLEELLKERNLALADVYNRYDAVLHLVTAADGAEEFYQWNDPSKESEGNNAARSEPPEIARQLDIKTRNAWIGHPHLRIFDNKSTFEEKVDSVIKEVFSLLGEPVPLEIERKFLIKKPSEEVLNNLGYISKTQIIQTYLKSTNTERRVRQRGTKKDGFSFFYTEKTDIQNGTRIEKEKKITPIEYIGYLQEADTSLHQISKTRYCFVYNNKYFELDIYPFSDEYAVLEIELNSLDEEIKFPNVEIVKEVTDDENYKNYSLAKTMKLN